MANENINKAILAIMDGCGAIPKNGRNNAQNYNFMKASDVLDHIRPLCVKHGVLITPEVLSYEITPYETKSGSRQFLVTQKVKYTFTHAKTGEFVETVVLGQGSDMGDKASNKAMTGATKYAYINTFLLSDGEDAENDDEPDPKKKTAKKKVVDRSEGKSDTSLKGEVNRLEKLWHEAGASKEEIIKVRKDRGGYTDKHKMNHTQLSNYLKFLKEESGVVS